PERAVRAHSSSRIQVRTQSRNHSFADWAHNCAALKSSWGYQPQILSTIIFAFPKGDAKHPPRYPEYALHLNSNEAIGNIFVALRATRSKDLVQIREDSWAIGLGFGKGSFSPAGRATRKRTGACRCLPCPRFIILHLVNPGTVTRAGPGFIAKQKCGTARYCHDMWPR